MSKRKEGGHPGFERALEKAFQMDCIRPSVKAKISGFSIETPHGIRGVKPAAKGTPVAPKFRSQLEADRAEFLEQRRLAGEILWWMHEPWRFALGGGAWYKPDSGIMYPDGRLEAEECKGFWREAARLRIKVAASLHPIPFYAITREGGVWKAEQFL